MQPSNAAVFPDLLLSVSYRILCMINKTSYLIIQKNNHANISLSYDSGLCYMRAEDC